MKSEKYKIRFSPKTLTCIFHFSFKKVNVMKKILHTFLIMLSLLALSSCSDNGESEYSLTNSIRIVSQTVSDMSVKASEGTIIVDAPSPIDATSTSNWFSTSVNANTITVKTTDNLNIGYRSGKVIIKSGNDVAEVAVIQKGSIISVDAKDMFLNDEDTTFLVPYNCNIDLKCQTKEQWITCKTEAEALHITVEENTTGHLRNGFVYYEAGSTKDSIFIQQCDIERDLLGEMLLISGAEETAPVSVELISETDTVGNVSYALAFSDYDLSIPVSIDENTCIITINAGQKVGTFQGHSVYTVLYDDFTNDINLEKQVGMSARFFYNEEDNATYAVFEDNGKWGNNHAASSIKLCAYDKQGNLIGSLLEFCVPILIK